MKTIQCSFLIQVVLIFGIFGSSRRMELKNLTTDDVEDCDDSIKITISYISSNVPTTRCFMLTDDCIPELKILDIVRHYMSLRPKQCKHNRFFLNYRRKYCTTQPVGINTFGDFPKRIAKLLFLPSWNQYTWLGLSQQIFRRNTPICKKKSI